jgi:hypothetical protein
LARPRSTAVSRSPPAVTADIFSSLIGIAVARYIYTFMKLNNPLYFIFVLVAFQIFHDGFFYLAIIQHLPKGHNSMIDIFKGYTPSSFP